MEGCVADQNFYADRKYGPLLPHTFQLGYTEQFLLFQHESTSSGTILMASSRTALLRLLVLKLWAFQICFLGLPTLY